MGYTYLFSWFCFFALGLVWDNVSRQVYKDGYESCRPNVQNASVAQRCLLSLLSISWAWNCSSLFSVMYRFSLTDDLPDFDPKTTRQAHLARIDRLKTRTARQHVFAAAMAFFETMKYMSVKVRRIQSSRLSKQTVFALQNFQSCSYQKMLYFLIFSSILVHDLTVALDKLATSHIIFSSAVK